MYTFTAFFALFLVSVVGASPPARKRDVVCNGHAELCDRSYGNITFLGSNNSPTRNITSEPSILGFQDDDVIGQLEAGVRALQMQLGMKKGDEDVHLCAFGKYALSKVIRPY